MNTSYPGRRFAYLISMVLTMILGLASRTFRDFLPMFFAENAGDALWAAMVYFGFRFLLVRKSLSTSILISFLFSYGIEFSQLYQADWIIQLRNTLLGGLILGKGFLAEDLLRYTAGILIGAAHDKIVVSLAHKCRRG